MKRALIYIICVVAALGASAQETATKDYALKLSDFAQLKVVNGINVVLHQSTDSAGMACFTTTQALADMIIFDSTPKRLKIELAETPDGAPLRNLPTVHVYASAPGKVENAADSALTVLLASPLPSFKARLVGNGSLSVRGIYANVFEGAITTGNGRLYLAGRAATAKLSNTGTGSIEAGSLQAKDVKAWVMGTGPIDCCATDRLTIVGAGSGTVYYTGKPATVSNRSIGIKAEAIE